MRFFRKRSPGKNEEDIAARHAQFDREWFAALNRFSIAAGFKTFEFKLTHPETGEIMKPHEGLAGTFNEWKPIQSAWDRRRLLFRVLLNAISKSMRPWHIANILVAIHQPDQGLALLQQERAPAADTEDYVEYCTAYTRVLVYLLRPEEALVWAQKAAQAAPNNRHIQMLLADSLALVGRCDESNAVYSTLIKSSAPSIITGASDIEKMFNGLFALETGACPSPVYAIQISEILENPQQAEEFWQLGEIEFYASPYFRMHHAYHLANSGKMDHGFAKLLALVQEMPWLREASLNLEILFRHFDPGGTEIMPEFQQQLRQTIAQNDWTTDGMQQIRIGNH